MLSPPIAPRESSSPRLAAKAWHPAPERNILTGHSYTLTGASQHITVSRKQARMEDTYAVKKQRLPTADGKRQRLHAMPVNPRAIVSRYFRLLLFSLRLRPAGGGRRGS